MRRAGRLLLALLLSGCAVKSTEHASRREPTPARAPEPKRDAAPPAAPEASRAEEIGRAVVRELGAGELDEVVARFDDRMRAALPEAALRETWRRVLQRSGPYVALGKVWSETRGEHELVHVETRFASAALETRVAVDGRGRVAGLFIRPLGVESAEWDPPDYADPKKLVEREVRVPDPNHPCATGTCGLPGTLTLPLGTGPFPAIVLVHGSGPQDRDQTLGAIRPFKDLAWGLANRGVAVLRYDKRTYFLEGRLSAEDVERLTLKEEAIDDALGAVKLLKSSLEIDPARIFVLGHSQGGTALPRIGKAEPAIAGFVSLAGSARPLEDVILEQVRYLVASDGRETEDEKAAIATLEAQVARVKALEPGRTVDRSMLPLGIPARYWLDLSAHPPAAVAAGERRPFLVLQGERDYQVTLADFRIWQTALAGNPNARFKTYPKLDHAFVAGEGPSTPEGYRTPGHVAEEVIRDVADFVVARR